jgi:hypothetical protein
MLFGAAHDIRVEAAAEAAVGRRHDHEMHPIATRSGK